MSFRPYILSPLTAYGVSTGTRGIIAARSRPYAVLAWHMMTDVSVTVANRFPVLQVWHGTMLLAEAIASSAFLAALETDVSVGFVAGAAADRNLPIKRVTIPLPSSGLTVPRGCSLEYTLINGDGVLDELRDIRATLIDL